MSYSLKALDGQRLKAIFDAAFLDCHLASDGDLIVENELRILVKPEPDKKLLKLVAFFGVKADRFQILEFCNRFNREMIVCRVFFADRQDAEGEWPVVFDYDLVVMPDEVLEPKAIVTLVRRFSEIVVGGIRHTDEDDLF